MNSTPVKVLPQIELEKLYLRREGLASLIYGTEIIVRLDNEKLLASDGLDEGLLASLVEKETSVFQTQVELIDGLLSKFVG